MSQTRDQIKRQRISLRRSNLKNPLVQLPKSPNEQENIQKDMIPGRNRPNRNFYAKNELSNAEGSLSLQNNDISVPHPSKEIKDTRKRQLDLSDNRYNYDNIKTDYENDQDVLFSDTESSQTTPHLNSDIPSDFNELHDKISNHLSHKQLAELKQYQTIFVFPIETLLSAFKASATNLSSSNDENHSGIRVSPSAGIYMSAVLRYLTNEIFNLAAGILSIEQVNKLKKLRQETEKRYSQDIGSGDRGGDGEEKKNTFGADGKDGNDGDNNDQVDDSDIYGIKNIDLGRMSEFVVPKLTISPEILEFIFQNDAELNYVYEQFNHSTENSDNTDKNS
jgi:hypothetical protein